MPETNRITEEAKRMGQEAQERAQAMGHEFQKAAESGFEVASRSVGEVNRGFQTMAAEMTDFSRRRWEDVLQSWQQLLQARDLGDVVEVQTQYAKRAIDAYMSQMSKLGEMYLGTVREVAKPLEQTSKKVY
jgi:phasin family protein